MQGADRVAAILLTMGKSLSGRLMKHFEPDEIKQITRSAADLKPVPAPQLGVADRGIRDPVRARRQPGRARRPKSQRMLDGVLPKEQIDEIMGDACRQARPLDLGPDLGGQRERAGRPISSSEHPQTAALILSQGASRRRPPRCSRICRPSSRDGLIRRMLTSSRSVEETMRLLERMLQQEFSGNLSRHRRQRGPSARIAEIINKLDRDQIDAVLQSLAVDAARRPPRR